MSLLPTLPGGVALNVETLGSGVETVLIHGLGTNMAFWYWGPARLIARRHRTIMYDLRGHGRSAMPASGYTLPAMCDDLIGLLDHLGIERAHIVGHSYGARVALCFAGQYPARVRTLTVADTQVRSLQSPLRLRDWPRWEDWKRQLASVGYTEFPDEDAVIDFRLLAEFSRYGGASQHAPMTQRQAKRQISVQRRDMGERGSRRWHQLLEATSARHELEDETPLDAAFLSSIRVPTLLIYGRHSHCVPTSDALLGLIPDSQRILIPQAGHFVPAVKPMMFAHAVNRFVDGGEVAPRQPGRRETMLQQHL